MGNPFIKTSDKGTKYISHDCSFNKLVLQKLPILGVEDSLEGKTFEKIFSVKSIVKEIEKKKELLNIESDEIEPNDIITVLNLTKSEDIEVAKRAKKIVKKFGYRLGIIFLTLRVAHIENRQANKSWTEDMWEYFKKLDDVLLVGGLASGEMGEKLLPYVLEIFEKAHTKPYNFIMFENASMVGVMGCATAIKQSDSVNLVLDMGHTNIKRLLVIKSNGEFNGTKLLPTEKSKYANKPKEKFVIDPIKAKKLHNYLVNIIIDAYTKGDEILSLSDEIIISIANYVVDGKLDNQRGGYAKLSILGENYAEILAEELSGRLRKKIKVLLVHDATAVAMYFNGYKNATCITLGTAFGISFTDISD